MHRTGSGSTRSSRLEPGRPRLYGINTIRWIAIHSVHSSVAQPPPLPIGPTNLWAIRREWLRSARSDTNPTHLPPSVVSHRATTLTTFVAVSVRKIHLHPATVMAAVQLI
jgi:hypothetical protein